MGTGTLEYVRHGNRTLREREGRNDLAKTAVVSSPPFCHCHLFDVFDEVLDPRVGGLVRPSPQSSPGRSVGLLWEVNISDSSLKVDPKRLLLT